MTRILLVVAMSVAAAGANAGLYTYDFTSGFTSGGVIADANPTGWSDTRTLGGITGAITDVNVRLNISGGYNGDLYGYLVHSTGFAVLLNRVGKTAGDSFGYGDSGFNITLDGQSSAHDLDVHVYNAAFPSPSFSGGQLTGIWREDGRAANPMSVTDVSSRDALLSSFNNQNANGDWTLFLADLSGSDTSTLVSWGLDISVVPEPTTWALGIFGALLTGRAFFTCFGRKSFFQKQ
jgi:subtilisin-like proprotein convertase family protein